MFIKLVTSTDGVGIVEGSGQQDDQEEGEKGIDPEPFGGMSLKGQMSSDFVESGVAWFGSADGSDGSIYVTVGGIW